MDPGENGHLSLPNKGKELGLYLVRCKTSEQTLIFPKRSLPTFSNPVWKQTSLYTCTRTHTNTHTPAHAALDYSYLGVYFIFHVLSAQSGCVGGRYSCVRSKQAILYVLDLIVLQESRWELGVACISTCFQSQYPRSPGRLLVITITVQGS